MAPAWPHRRRRNRRAGQSLRGRSRPLRHRHRQGRHPRRSPPTKSPAPLEALVLGTRDYVRKCGFRQVFVGLSGGIDSAVVASIAVDAVGKENVPGVAMPGPYSSEGSMSRRPPARSESRHRVPHLAHRRDLRRLQHTLARRLSPAGPKTPPRKISRRASAAISSMALSNKFGSMVLSTGNKSEMAVGYCTLYGDMAGGLAVISDVPENDGLRARRAHQSRKGTDPPLNHRKTAFRRAAPRSKGHGFPAALRCSGPHPESLR